MRRGGGVGSRSSTRGTGLVVGPIDEQRPDAPRSEVVDGELEHRLEHLGIAVVRARGHGVDPAADGRLVVPAEAAPAQHAEASDDPDEPVGVALHDRGVEHAGQHDEVTLGAGGTVEHHPLVRAVGAAQEPARKPVGEAASVRERLVDGPAGDVELRSRRPRRRIGQGSRIVPLLDDPSLVDGRAERVIDLLQQHLAEGVGSLEAQAALVELLGESSQSPRGGVRHPTSRSRSGFSRAMQ